jgi:hypothetical protein
MPVQAAGALHVDLVVAVDHDLRDAVVLEQLFQRPQGDGLVEHLLAQQLAVELARDLVVLLLQKLAQEQLGFLAQRLVAHARDVLPAQVHGLEQARM